jgi:hypothetical protein
MENTSGIIFEKDSAGVKRYVRIDLKIHGKDIEPFLQKLDISNSSLFENEWSDSHSPEQFKKKMRSRINVWKEKLK